MIIIKFAKEYEITENNIFVYRNAKEAAKILEDGTGVIFFGFSECAWCKAYVPMLNEAAIQIGLDKIYYVDIKKDREKNTKAYQEIVYYLNSNLLNDEEGNKRIYVPNLTIVVDGIVVGNNNLTSMEVGDPKEYWTEKRQNNFKTNIKNLLKPYHYLLKILFSFCPLSFPLRSVKLYEHCSSQSKEIQ